MSFWDYKVSTKTFIAKTNLVRDINNVYGILPVTDYIVVQKKRGRKKKTAEENPNKDIADGSIISIQNGNNTRGISLKGDKPKTTFFRNSMSIVIYVDGKMINSKISRNGKFQMTGCKKNEQAEECISYFWKYIKDHKTAYTFSEGADLTVFYEPVMYNIDFSLGFEVNRENLDNYINRETKYFSLLETTFGYTGVNIKMPVVVPEDKLDIKHVVYNGDDKQENSINYVEYSQKYKDRKKTAQKYNTFLVFQSGKVIMSGQDGVFMEDTYYEFMKIIEDCTHLIKDTIDN